MGYVADLSFTVMPVMPVIDPKVLTFKVNNDQWMPCQSQSSNRRTPCISVLIPLSHCPSMCSRTRDTSDLVPGDVAYAMIGGRRFCTVPRSSAPCK